MRTIRLEERESGHTWVWLAAAAVIGLGVGVLVAERTRGRRMSLGKLVTRGRGLASKLVDNIGPLLETARGLKDAWDGDPDEDDERSRAEREDEALDEELDEEELDDEADDDSDDEDDEDDEDDAQSRDALDARVLEAFSHDPILAERAVEIEEVGDGVILLRGRVRSAREVKHALTMARGVPGVTRVREKLTVPRPR